MPTANQATGSESSLSNWAGDYVTDFLGRGRALGQAALSKLQGPLAAGTSGLQNQAFTGLANLAVPTADMGGFNTQSYTTPGYLSNI